ncbi:hypothetical protein ACWGN5_38545 [Streptomyces sp. NPDC055815]
MTTRRTVLAAVLGTHGERCGCEGACGSHQGIRCLTPHREKPLHAAPYPPRTTDVANAAVPAEELWPWCPACWRKALKIQRDHAATKRLRELQDAQGTLFDPATLTAS